MRYDKEIKLYQTLKEPNGIGGFEKVNVHLVTIKGYATPVKINTTFTNGMLISQRTTKIFTKDAEPEFVSFEDIDILEYNGKTYNVLFYANFGKVKMFEVEVNGNE